MLCFSTQMWPEIMVSRVPREVEHQGTLFDKYFTKRAFYQCFKLALASYLCPVPETSTICVIYSDMAWEQGFLSPRKNHSFFCCVFTTQELISLFQACYQLVCEVLLIQQILFVKHTWMWPKIMGVLSPGRNFSLKSSIFGIIQSRFRFHSIFSLHPVCEVSNVFIVVESTWKWPENKYPEIPRSTKISVHVVNTSVCQDSSIVSKALM